MLAILITVIAGIWRVYSKADQPGWGVLIPIYNVYLMCKIAGRPGWWVLLMFIPVVNLIIAITLSIGIARNFGKGAGFGLGLERAVQYATGMANIRDVIPFPRTPGSADF